MLAGPRHAEGDVVACAAVEQLAEGAGAGEVDVGHARWCRAPGRRYSRPVRRQGGLDLVRGSGRRWRTRAAWRRGRRARRARRGLRRRRRAGSSWWCPARGRGRAAGDVRSAGSGRGWPGARPRPMPCSTPMSTTVSSVTAASANSKRSKRAMATRSARRRAAVATKIRMAASVASGTSLRTSRQAG